VVWELGDFQDDGCRDNAETGEGFRDEASSGEEDPFRTPPGGELTLLDDVRHHGGDQSRSCDDQGCRPNVERDEGGEKCITSVRGHEVEEPECNRERVSDSSKDREAHRSVLFAESLSGDGGKDSADDGGKES
jgi:hypothetical protein